MCGIHSVCLIWSQESKKFLDCQLAYFTAYADWANLMVSFLFSTSLSVQKHYECLCTGFAPLLICVFPLRSHSRWAAVAQWQELWILLRSSSVHSWWSLWWGFSICFLQILFYFFTFGNIFVFTCVLSLSLSLECVLVQSGMVLDLLHPQHHLLCETSQVLPENEIHWRLWVSTTNKKM